MKPERMLHPPTDLSKFTKDEKIKYWRRQCYIARKRALEEIKRSSRNDLYIQKCYIRMEHISKKHGISNDEMFNNIY